ncbi:hypothetical protein IWX50DRAFT_170827 [Phyllosticta citricarpa]
MGHPPTRTAPLGASRRPGRRPSACWAVCRLYGYKKCCCYAATINHALRSTSRREPAARLLRRTASGEARSRAIRTRLRRAQTKSLSLLSGSLCPLDLGGPSSRFFCYSIRGVILLGCRRSWAPYHWLPLVFLPPADSLTRSSGLVGLRLGTVCRGMADGRGFGRRPP